MRLDKLLANLKFGTRTEVKKLIKAQHVIINGVVVRSPDVQVDAINDTIFVQGTKINYREWVYYMMNKPKGFLSSTLDPVHQTVIDLLKDEDQCLDVFPCGRLDLDSEGLMILSNDGKFAHRLTSPKKEIYKQYFVEVLNPINNEAVKVFYDGMRILDGNEAPYMTKPAKLEILTSKTAYVYISEGKFHQVKRMFGFIGNEVLNLKRVAIGTLNLDASLELGAYREITENELNQLFENKLEVIEWNN